MASGEDFAGSGPRPGALIGRVRASPDQVTELVVECLSTSARRNREPTAPSEDLVVTIARFGTALAQRMAEQHEPLTRLRVRALVDAIDAEPNDQTAHPAITINLLAEGATVKRDDLRQAALVAIGERSHWRSWPQDVRVELGTVEVVSRPADEELNEAAALAASAPSGTSPPPPNEVAEVPPPPVPPAPLRAAHAPVADERLEPAATRGAPRRRGVRAAVLLGVVAAVAVGALVTTTLAPRLQSPEVEVVRPEVLGVVASQPTAAATPAPTPRQAVAPTVAPTAVAVLLVPTATEVLVVPTVTAVLAALPPTVVQPAATPVVAAPAATPLVAAAAVAPVVAAPSPSIASGPRTVFEAQFARARPPGWRDDRQGVAWFDVDGYHLRARTPDRFVALAVPQTGPLENVLVTLTFRKVAGPPGGGVGVILRDQEPAGRDGLNQTGNFYVLEVSDSGSVGIWRRDADAWIDVVPWTPTRPGGVVADRDTVLEAQAVGSRLQLRVNGEETIGATDNTLGVGGVGVFLGGDDNEAVLVQLTVRALPTP